MAHNTDGQIFVAHGDITAITADAIVFPTRVEAPGRLATAFQQRFPDFISRYQMARRAHSVVDAELRAGRSFWIPLCSEQEAATWEKSPDPHPPFGVVAVQVFDIEAEKDRGWTPDHPAYRAAAGAIRTGVEALQALRAHLPEGGTRRFLLALPALRTGGGGDRATPLPAARLQVRAVREVLRECHPGVDVVFVTYTPDLHEVYLEARRQEGAAPAVVAEALPEAWHQLVAAARGGECVVFAGSGLSRDACITGYHELLQRLAADLGLPTPKDDLDSYFDLAQWHREQFPQQQQALIRSFFGVSAAQPTLAHYLLTSLPASFFITTNYDGLLEAALGAQRREPERVITPQDVARTGRRQATYVVKFHGDADEPKTVVLTRDDYDTFFEQPRGRAMAALLEGLLLNQPFLFVGYSLRDPNFRQIYNRIAGLLRDAKRPAFATTFEPVTAHARKQWADKGLHLIEIRDEGFGQGHFLWRLLDQLAASAVGSRRLFLAEDPEAPGHGADAGLRRALIDGPGEQIKRVHYSRRSLALDEVRHTARTLQFLTEQGWRPRQVTLTLLWWRLAQRLEEQAMAEASRGTLRPAEAEELGEEAREMLAAALRHAEVLPRIEAIRDQRAALAEDLKQGCLLRQRRIVVTDKQSATKGDAE